MLFIFLLVCILKNTRVNPVPTDIQDLAARGQNWRFYDENFRFLRQTQASIVPWSSIHWQLWLRSQYSQNKKLAAARNYGPPTHARQGTPFQVPKGYCFKFHKGIPCLGCDFKHSCFKCQGAHIVPNIVIFVHLQKNHSPVLDALPSPHLPTPVKIKLVTELLRGYPPSIMNILISGFSWGFPLHYQGNHRAFEDSNLLSALENP